MSDRVSFPPWLSQIATAAAIPLWLWVISLSQERAAMRLQISALEKTQEEHTKELKEAAKIVVSIGWIEKELARLAKAHDDD